MDLHTTYIRLTYDLQLEKLNGAKKNLTKLQFLMDLPARLQRAVRDTGSGIPPDKHTQIFDSFSQVDSSTSRRFGGTGLGLAISQQLVEMMRGRIWVESGEGVGSTFRFTARFGLGDQPARRSEPALVQGMRVLVVDDHAINRKILEEIL